LWREIERHFDDPWPPAAQPHKPLRLLFRLTLVVLLVLLAGLAAAIAVVVTPWALAGTGLFVSAAVLVALQTVRRLRGRRLGGRDPDPSTRADGPGEHHRSR
jgi:membrane protein implicated in regulation of membrane protease activity